MNNGNIEKEVKNNIEVTKDNYVTIEDIHKLGLKVAEIVNAERVEKTDKLVKLFVRIGKEERQIIAGIAKYYSTNELIGKKIIIVSNMKPAKIKGIESRGMLLAASDTDAMSLLTVDRDISSGVEIK